MSKRVFHLSAAAGLFVGALFAAAADPPRAPTQDPMDDGQVRRASYVGAETCKKCHYQAHRSMTDEGHAHAWETLPEEYRDPAALDEAGRPCISCHVTGWGRSGGFVDPVTSEHLLGVQCEACHGPGSRHVALGREMLEEKRDALAPGEQSWIVLRGGDCVNCHNPHLSQDHH